MIDRDKIKQILNRTSSGGCGFWLGQPHADTESIYLNKLALSNIEQFREMIKDECRWYYADCAYKHPEGKPMFDPLIGAQRHSHGDEGCFSDCTNADEVKKYPWPNPDYLNFTDIIKTIKEKSDKAVFSGLWSCFYHIVADFFGMENYFVKMYTDPEVVDAVTSQVVDFYLEANERYFKIAGDCFDTFFLGNDFGTQVDLMVSPEMFQRFVLPGLKKLVNLAKKYNKKVLLHSCGSIYKVIPYLIDLGVDGLHPLQAKAANMDAKTLAREFKNDIAFVGGIDTQELLINGKPSDIRDEVYRVKELLGPNLIVSPSHEAILPNVPLENVFAMAEAALE